MSRIIGIDLGTTNSCAAFRNSEGLIELIPHKGGGYTVPSIFAIDDTGKELVGEEAKRQWQLNPKKTIHGVKRLVGRSFQTELVDGLMRYVGYSIIRGEESQAIEIPVANKRFSVAEIQAKILGKIVAVASAHFNEPVTQAVVTVPAYFNDRQRQATKEAGKICGLDILRIINEPTAAVLAYGLGKGLNETVAVYDLGGGTFDISVIEIRDRTFEVKATGGDIFLGGLDFDNLLIDRVLGWFEQTNHIDLRQDPIAMQRVKDMAEKVKTDLSSRPEVPFSIPFITMTADGKPLDIQLSISRSELDALAMPLIQRTLEVTGRVLKDAGKTAAQIDQVLLVGGQTRMPAIHAAITQMFGKPPSKSVHPDEAVAVGAAIFADSLSNGSLQPIQLLDVIPMAIGIERADGAIHRLFARNASVPNARGYTFTTSSDNQSSLAMRIFQGDQDSAQKNELLGEFNFSGLRPGPAGSVRVEVVFQLSIDGILSLSAKDKDTGAEMKQVLKVEINAA